MRAPAEPVAGASGSGTVVLELGPGAGALVLDTPAEMNGAEIEISLVCDDDQHGHRTHALVRPRHISGGARYAAVYPGLPPGEYTIWRADGLPVLTVAVGEGVATSARWPARAR